MFGQEFQERVCARKPPTRALQPSQIRPTEQATAANQHLWGRTDQPAQTKLQRQPAVDPLPGGMMEHRDGKQERGRRQPALT